MKNNRYLTGRIASMPPSTENFIREKVKDSGKRKDSNKKEHSHKRPDAKIEAKYREALTLYTETQLSCREICTKCGVTTGGLQAYLRRYHREKMLARYHVQCNKEEAHNIKLCHNVGQTPAAYIKYRDAIAACDDIRFIDYNISQIARLFKLNGSALGNQLRRHYPEIVRHREQEREKRGIKDGHQRGAHPWCKEQYAEAVKLLHTTEKTIPEAALACNVSASGLSEHILFYHPDLLKKRQKKREKAGRNKRKGRMTGNGRLHIPTPEMEQQYRKALELYTSSSMTLREIAAATNVTEGGLRNYLHTWHKELVFRRRGIVYNEGDTIRLSETKSYLKSTAAKYAKAIERLKKSDLPTAAIAAEFKLHPECFREYLKEHEPELYARQGMTKTTNGKIVSARSLKRYEEAIHLYETTTENLKSIATRLGIPYNSVGGFIRRNLPETIEKHNALLAGQKPE